MKTIALTNSSKVVLVDDEDWEKLNRYSWFLKSSASEDYAVRSDWNKGHVKTIRMHRMIMGINQRGLQVHHLNGNTLDNRKENLQIMSASMHSKTSYQRSPLAQYKNGKG